LVFINTVRQLIAIAAHANGVCSNGLGWLGGRVPSLSRPAEQSNADAWPKPGLDSQPQPGHTVERVHPVELVVCLLIVLVVPVTAAQRLNVSYPIVLVIGGLVLA
jgi:hypothetical protein